MGKVKVLMEIIGILFMVILISLALNIFFLRYDVINIHKIFLDGEDVILSQNARQQLADIYEPMPSLEIPSCLAGEINSEEGIIIDQIIQAEIIESNSNNVTYVSCPAYIGTNKVFGTIHNHPNEVCRLSDTDIQTYANDLNFGQEIIGLYCGDYVFFVLAELGYEVMEG